MHKCEILVILTFMLLRFTFHCNGQKDCKHYTNDAAFKSFTNVGDNYYIFNASGEVNWMSANHLCRTKNAYLASIETREELNDITAFLRDKGIPRDLWFWLSGTDYAQSHSFVWFSTGESIPKYQWLWQEGHPNKTNDENHCIKLQPEHNAYVIVEELCSKGGAFICEIDPELVKMEALMAIGNEILPSYIKCPMAVWE